MRAVPAGDPLEQRLLQVAPILQERLRSVIELLTVLRLGAPPEGGPPWAPVAVRVTGTTTRRTTHRSSRPSPTSCAPTATS